MIDCTLAFFEQRCLIALRDEQEKLLPGNHLIALYCDAVRLAREYCDAMKSSPRLLSSPGVSAPVGGVSSPEKDWHEVSESIDAAAGVANPTPSLSHVKQMEREQGELEDKGSAPVATRVRQK